MTMLHMLVHCGLLLLFLNCVRTKENIYGDELASRASSFSLWPSVHNAATVLRIRREISNNTGIAGANEGTVGEAAKQPADAVLQPSASLPLPEQSVDPDNAIKETKSSTFKSETTTNVPGKKIETTTVASANNTANSTSVNATSTEKPKALDLNNPGVVKRGVIVFGGFALMAVAYFIFYKRKNKNSDMSNSLGMNDANQFRYGVLQNEDAKDNLESTRVPLTLESEDEIDDDLEIFDLMQKKKSLSYVNLQQNDEDIVLTPRDVDIEGDNLLLDIEDASSDTLINWSNNGSKSIL